MDKLEEHIRKNREELDRYSASPRLWGKIKNELKTGKPQPFKWISIAAMVVVILGTVLVLSRPGTRWTESRLGNSSVNETEIYYNNLVNTLYKEATPLLTGYPEIKKELNTDISQLDSICSEIKKDLKDNVANQEVVEALIQNYRIKIRLLEDMLIILKEETNNPEKSKSHEL